MDASATLDRLFAQALRSNQLVGVTLRRFTGSDDYNAPQYEPAPGSTTVVRDFQGQEVVSRGYVVTHSTVAVSPHDHLTLPDSSTPTILRIDSLRDNGAVTLQRIFF